MTVADLVEQTLAKLALCQKNKDTATAHEDADDTLCEFLCGLGFSDLVAEYRKIDKWFE